MLKFRNTLTGRVEEFHPMNEGEVPDMKDENPEVKREKEDPEVEMPLPAERTR